jgi:hypothetical protein
MYERKIFASKTGGQFASVWGGQFNRHTQQRKMLEIFSKEIA